MSNIKATVMVHLDHDELLLLARAANEAGQLVNDFARQAVLAAAQTWGEE